MASQSAAARRHAEVMDRFTSIDDRIQAIEDALIGTAKEPGYFEKVRTIEGWMKGQKKAQLAIGLIIGGDIVLRLIGLIYK